MAGKRVAILDPDGKFATIDEEHVSSLEAAGGRVLSGQEVAEQKADEDYAKKSTVEKVTSAASIAGPVPFAARAAIKAATGHGDEIVPTLPPAVESYKQGVSETFAGGLPTLAEKELARAGGGDQAAQRYVETIDTAKEANPTAHVAGAVAGIAGSIAAGGPKGGAGSLGKIIPSVGVASAGGALERATVNALSGLAKRGALGRAATTGAGMAVRGAFEGAALSGASEATENIVHDTPVVGEKLYTALGHGALASGALGGILGFGGSLGASGARSGYGAAKRAFSRASETEASSFGLAPGSRPIRALRSLEESGVADAGLRETASDGENALAIGGDRGREVGLRPNVYQRGGAAKASRSPIDWETRTRQFPEPGAGLPETTFKINPDAGLGLASKAKAADESVDVLRHLKARPRDVLLAPGGETAEVGAPPIQIGDTGAPLVPATLNKRPGVSELLSNPSDAARALAQDQAFRAVGGGFGLQSTRYAKEAAKHFPNGTRDLGEIMLRHGIIDASETATPLQAAWKAVKEGTPADMLPKLQAAGDTVGGKIGDITDASGARVPVQDALGAALSVAKGYDKQAGRGPLATAVRSYAEELSSAIKPGADGKVSVRDLLAQRKVLDDIVYEETKTLDPRGRVKALREVRANLEGVITDALDAASGKVKGELANDYKALKKDYHGLRILTEAAEDSAARSAKGATFGLGEKFAAASSVAGGHFLAAPVLALGGKAIRERGNAAAAAFLSRAADNGSIEAAVSRLNARVKSAAAGALHEGPPPQPKDVKSAPSPARGKEEVAQTQAKAKAIVEWMAEMQGNPKHLSSKLEDAAADLGRAAGPNAADSYTAATLRAISFVSTFIPQRPRRDPLDPRSVPPMTYDEADRLLRATRYAVKPATIFDDFERGKITPEGLQAAQEFAATSLDDFRLNLQENVEARMMRGERFSQAQRLRIDRLLGYPAGADLRPAAVARLQANLMKAPDEPPPANGATGHKPVDLKVQQTGFDAIEARKEAS